MINTRWDFVPVLSTSWDKGVSVLQFQFGGRHLDFCFRSVQTVFLMDGLDSMSEVLSNEVSYNVKLFRSLRRNRRYTLLCVNPRITILIYNTNSNVLKVECCLILLPDPKTWYSYFVAIVHTSWDMRYVISTSSYMPPSLFSHKSTRQL